jgi:cytidylate kinase
MGGGRLMSLVIAIDGPAGTGKSTVSREVARKRGLDYLDTGATYRVGALYCLREGVDLSSKDDVTAMLATMNVEMRLSPTDPRVLLDGEDVTSQLHTDTISLVVSKVATNLDARAVLRAVQRNLIDVSREQRGVVAEGRDVTSVVAPDAEVRILLTADEEVRIARRAGEGADPATVREAVIGRDAQDSTVVEFHVAADGVVTIDTTSMTVDEVVDAVLRLADEVSA